MNPKDAKLRDPLYHHEEDYPHANILGPSQNTSRKRLNYTTYFLIATAVSFAVSYIFFH